MVVFFLRELSFCVTEIATGLLVEWTKSLKTVAIM